MRAAALLALAASLTGAIAQDSVLGFNSGATDDTGKVKKQADFEKEFSAAQNLQKTPGTFNSIRLYTNIQGDTKTDPIEAFAAAIKTKTKLLLGLWVSGTDNIDNEITALKNGIKKHGKPFTDLVVGISVGSEDLYRVSESGIRNKVGLGQDADAIVKFIKEVKEAVKGTDLEKSPIGHVDTWTSWVNETNKAVIENSDFVGVNAFPYYEDDKDNPITNAKTLFFDALNKTEDAAGDKPVWITGTGWPYTGPDFGKAKATLENSKTFWDEVGCSLFGRKNVWWYVLRDSNPDNKAKFAVTENLQSQTRFDMTCPAAAGAPAPSNNSTNNQDNNSSQQGSGGNGNGEGAGSVISVNSVMMTVSVVLTFAWFL